MKDVLQEGLPPQNPLDLDQDRRWEAAVKAVQNGRARFIGSDMIELIPPNGFTPEEEAARQDSYLRFKRLYNEGFFADQRRQREEEVATWRKLRAEGF